MAIYGYARVSSEGQDLQAQVDELIKAGASVVYADKATGMNADRPEFIQVLSELDAGDTLIVTKLDRFARSAEDGVKLIRNLLSKGVNVRILNMGLIEDTSIGRLMLRMMSAFAEFERDLVVERLAEGKAIAKQREDYREGRPRKYSKEQMIHAMKLLESHSYTQVERMTGISKATLTRYKRKMKEKAGAK